VIGFKYFSAQGKGKADAGFAYRYAYFNGTCPASAPGPRDCGIIRSGNPKLFNAGTMYHPKNWTTIQAQTKIIRSVRSALESRYPGNSRSSIDYQTSVELNRELLPDFSRFTGETID
jgi:hypothetical protein